MSEQGMTRRGFLATTSSVAAALSASAVTARAAAGANERIRIASIGIGGRGSELMRQIHTLAKEHNVEVAAVCDVWKPNLDKAATQTKEYFGSDPQKTTRFGEVLKRDDIDAVIIATPDFAHTPVMIEALKAGKDVYVEKPMSISIELATQAVDLAREKKRVVQVGTQRRSEGRWKGAQNAIKAGELGYVSRISAGNHFNHARWARDYSDCKSEDVDWDAYLFCLPKVPFDPKLLRRWHLFKMCTNGLSGLWMAHLIDAAHIVMDAKYPRSAVAHGGTYYWKDGREHSDVFHALLDYPEGFMFSWSMSLTNGAGTHYTVHGTKATLDLEKMVFTGAGTSKDKELDGKKIQAPPDQDHMANWLKCLRTRELPNADIQYGHQHTVATVIAAEALHTGRRQMYDQAGRKMYAG